MNIASTLICRHTLVLSRNMLTADESIFTRLVRWRKRRWSPRAPSKIYYVRTPTPMDPNETEELRDRYNNYRHQIKSLRLVFHNQSLFCCLCL